MGQLDILARWEEIRHAVEETGISGAVHQNEEVESEIVMVVDADMAKGLRVFSRQTVPLDVVELVTRYICHASASGRTKQPEITHSHPQLVAETY